MPKKKAKLAHDKRRSGVAVEEAASKLVALSAGHFIGRFPSSPRTKCGLRVNDPEGTRTGWSYGLIEDVTCEECKDDGEAG